MSDENKLDLSGVGTLSSEPAFTKHRKNKIMLLSIGTYLFALPKLQISDLELLLHLVDSTIQVNRIYDADLIDYLVKTDIDNRVSVIFADRELVVSTQEFDQIKKRNIQVKEHKAKMLAEDSEK